MKVRNGFVSNSSSSSFICCIAQIKDREKVQNWISTLVLNEYENEYDYSIQKSKNINKNTGGLLQRDTNGNLVVNSFMASVSLDRSKIDDNDEILSINIVNNEGDCGSFYPDYDGDIDYDIDLDFFDDNQIEIYNGLNEENGFGLINKTYGAGRNR